MRRPGLSPSLSLSPSGQLGSAGAQAIGSCRATLISLSTGVGSAAFTGPIKHRSRPLQHTACPGKLSPTGPGRTSVFFKELISQTRKITTHAMGVCALKDNYRVTPPPWRLVWGRGAHPPPQRPRLVCPHRALGPVVSGGPGSSPAGRWVLLALVYRRRNKGWGHRRPRQGGQSWGMNQAGPTVLPHGPPCSSPPPTACLHPGPSIQGPLPPRALANTGGPQPCALLGHCFTGDNLGLCSCPPPNGMCPPPVPTTQHTRPPPTLTPNWAWQEGRRKRKPLPGSHN